MARSLMRSRQITQISGDGKVDDVSCLEISVIFSVLASCLLMVI